MDPVVLDTADLDLADLVPRVERGEHIVLTHSTVDRLLVDHPLALPRELLAIRQGSRKGA